MIVRLGSDRESVEIGIIQARIMSLHCAVRIGVVSESVGDLEDGCTKDGSVDNCVGGVGCEDAEGVAGENGWDTAVGRI